MQDPHWIPLAKEAITLIFKLGDGPDSMVEEIIKEVCRRIQEDQGQELELTVDATVLKRLCFLAGHIALCMLIYLDVNVFTELKRRNWMREQKKEKEAKSLENSGINDQLQLLALVLLHTSLMISSTMKSGPSPSLNIRVTASLARGIQ